MTFESTFEDHSFQISYVMDLTMINGKVCSTIAGTKSSHMTLDNINKKTILEESLRLSTLHVWIRFIECVFILQYFIHKMASTKCWREKIGRQEKKGVGIKNWQAKAWIWKFQWRQQCLTLFSECSSFGEHNRHWRDIN